MEKYKSFIETKKKVTMIQKTPFNSVAFKKADNRNII